MTMSVIMFLVIVIVMRVQVSVFTVKFFDDFFCPFLQWMRVEYKELATFKANERFISSNFMPQKIMC